MKHVDPLQRQKRKKQAEERERERERERGRGKKGENKIKLESEEERRARLREKQVIQGEREREKRGRRERNIEKEKGENITQRYTITSAHRSHIKSSLIILKRGKESLMKREYRVGAPRFAFASSQELAIATCWYSLSCTGAVQVGSRDRFILFESLPTRTMFMCADVHFVYDKAGILVDWRES